MVMLKVGARLRSAISTTEIIVVKAPAREVEILCGGVPMLGTDEERPAAQAVDPMEQAVDPMDEPTLLGKRYINTEEDLEVLCTKAGDGSLAVDGQRLAMKEAKPLPSSD